MRKNLLLIALVSLSSVMLVFAESTCQELQEEANRNRKPSSNMTIEESLDFMQRLKNADCKLQKERGCTILRSAIVELAQKSNMQDFPVLTFKTFLGYCVMEKSEKWGTSTPTPFCPAFDEAARNLSSHRLGVLSKGLKLVFRIPGCFRRNPKCDRYNNTLNEFFKKVLSGIDPDFLDDSRYQNEGQLVSELYDNYKVECRGGKEPQICTQVADGLADLLNGPKTLRELRNDHWRDLDELLRENRLFGEPCTNFSTSPSTSTFCASTFDQVLTIIKMRPSDELFNDFEDTFPPLRKLLGFWLPTCLSTNRSLTLSPVPAVNVSNDCSKKTKNLIDGFGKQQISETDQAFKELNASKCFDESVACKRGYSYTRQFFFNTQDRDVGQMESILMYREMLFNHLIACTSHAPSTQSNICDIDSFAKAMQELLKTNQDYAGVMSALRNFKSFISTFALCVQNKSSLSAKLAFCKDLGENLRELFVRASFAPSPEELRNRISVIVENIKIFKIECSKVIG